MRPAGEQLLEHDARLETRELWAAAWLDNHLALQHAYRAVLSVPDAERRRALLLELSNLPIEMDEVAAVKARREQLERQSAEPAQHVSRADVRLAQARVRLDWARRFAAHYAKVGAVASVEARP